MLSPLVERNRVLQWKRSTHPRSPCLSPPLLFPPSPVEDRLCPVQQLAETQLAARLGHEPTADEWVGLLFNMAEKNKSCQSPLDYGRATMDRLNRCTALHLWHQSWAWFDWLQRQPEKNWISEYLLGSFCSVLIIVLLAIPEQLFIFTLNQPLNIPQIFKCNVGFTRQTIAFVNGNLSFWSYSIGLKCLLPLCSNLDGSE